MTENIPAVSVIIPMYNTEKYISECLQSLLYQTLENIEVIVVDDCSTDNSLAVAENFIPAFESKNKKLLTITLKPNSGCPGIPRNIALNYATGKYIYFMDSDDFLDSNALEDFYKVAEEFNADVVHAKRYFEYKEIGGKFISEFSFSDSVTRQPTLETSDISQRMSNFIEKKYHSMIWGKFFRREFLMENDIKFPALTISEDFIFSFMCLACAKNYVQIPFIGYHYRKRVGSVSNSSATTVKASLNLLEGVYVLDTFMKRQNFFIENPKYQYLVLDIFNQMFSDLIVKHIFFTKNLEPEEIYNFYSKEIFSLNPQKNIPLTAYLFVSTNIYKMLVNQQAAEIAELKKIIAELKGD